MSPLHSAIAAAISSMLILLTADHAPAAQIKILAGSAIEAAMAVLIPQFEQQSGHKVILDSDAHMFGGCQRVDPDVIYACQSTPMYDRAQSIQIYLPARSAQVLAPK